MNTAYLLLGSNTGDREGIMMLALAGLSSAGCTVVRRSGFWETAPWGNTDQHAFLNLAVAVETPQDADSLLRTALSVEASLGRIRNEKWGPRTIDIDILLFERSIIQSDHLQVPHPFLPQRRFALAPLAEIAPDYVHPLLNKSVQYLLDNCPDDSAVVRLS